MPPGNGVAGTQQSLALGEIEQGYRCGFHDCIISYSRYLSINTDYMKFLRESSLGAGWGVHLVKGEARD